MDQLTDNKHTAEELFRDLVDNAENTPKGQRTAVQRLTLAFADLDAEIQNGGCHQYLDNVCRGGDFRTLTSLYWLLLEAEDQALDMLGSIINSMHGLAADEDGIPLVARLNELDNVYDKIRPDVLPALCRFLGADPVQHAKELAEQAEKAAHEQQFWAAFGTEKF